MISLIDLKERIALNEKFSPEERDFILDAINAWAEDEGGGGISARKAADIYRALPKLRGGERKT